MPQTPGPPCFSKLVVVELVELWHEGHRPQNHRALHGFSGQGMRPTPEGATAATSITGKWRQTGQVLTRGASRWSAGLWVAGPVSNFYCVGEGVRIPSMASITPGVGRLHALEMRLSLIHI